MKIKSSRLHIYRDSLEDQLLHYNVSSGECRIEGEQSTRAARSLPTCLTIRGYKLAPVLSDSKVLARIHPLARKGKWQHFRGRLHGQHIDMDQVRMWLNTCSEWHGDHCEILVFPQSKDPRLSRSFRVVDVQEKCLVRPEPKCTYVALSYKFGGVVSLQAKMENISYLETPGSLNSLEGQLPNTVREAMRFAHELGQRYLWVDQLCIVQDNWDNKQEAINEMTGVYAFAYLTMIVADGEDANAGLKGYGSRPRGYEQISVPITSSLKAVVVPDLLDMFAASSYEERAWT